MSIAQYTGRISLAAVAARGEGRGGLAKTLGPFSVIGLGIGCIIGTGIFVLTGTAAAAATRGRRSCCRSSSPAVALRVRGPLLRRVRRR